MIKLALKTPLILSLVTVFLLVSCKPISEAEEPSLYGNALSEPSASKAVLPGQTISLPQDHLSHPEYAVEWWYLTANLFDQKGNQYPLQWTLFRFSNENSSSTWHDGNQFMAHAKLMNQDKTWFNERFARGGVGNAGVGLVGQEQQFTAFMDDWCWQSHSEALLPAKLSVNLSSEVEVSLSLNTKKPFVLNGDAGHSIKQKDGAHASMYYSQPFINLSGTLKFDDKEVTVSGQGWFDHEWSARLTDQQTLGWDWFSLHLSGGHKLMVFKVRHKILGDSWFGSYVSNDGRQQHLNGNDIVAKELAFTDVDDRKMPLHWRISLPQKNIDIEISPFKQDQFNRAIFSYYEGAVNIQGTHTGFGFMELTGY